MTAPPPIEIVKPETNKEPPPPPSPPEEPQPGFESLICKTVVLKVSIHCQGCARKVKKVLQNIDGIYNIDIDLRQQKVTVKGIVDSEIMIKQLNKTGKHAELWPDTVEPKKKRKKKKKKKKKDPNSSSQQNKEKQSDQESGDESNQSGEENDQKETVKLIVQDTAKNNVLEGSATNGKIGVHYPEPKPEMRQTVMFPAGYPPPPMAEKKVTIAVHGNDENEIGGGDRKVRMKGVTVIDDSNHHHMAPNESPPRHHHTYYQHPPPHYYAPTPSMYNVNYHTAYPNAKRHGAATAYYTSTQPHLDGHVTEMDPSPYDLEPYYYTYTSLPSYNSFEFLSDENPNGCNIV